MPNPHKNNPMAFPKTRRQPLRKWHRWIGYISFFFVLILCITGLILNRTESLGLNQITLKNAFISSLYGTSPNAPPVHYFSDGHWISWLDSRLYLNGDFMENNAPYPLGATHLGDLIIIGARDQLSLYLKDGSLVETINISHLPGEILALGKTAQGKFYMESKAGIFTSDAGLTAWSPALESLKFTPSLARPAPQQLDEKILLEFQGQGISLYRLTLDLHSGHIMGPYGSYLMDFAAICLIFLGITGFMQRRPSDKGRQKKKTSR